MQSLSELLAKAEAKGVDVIQGGDHFGVGTEEHSLLAIVQWLAERGVSVYREYQVLWVSHKEGGWYTSLDDATDFRTAVLAAFDRELARDSAGKASGGGGEDAKS